MKCCKSDKRYCTTTTEPKNSLTQETNIKNSLAREGWRVVRIIRGVEITAYAIGDGYTPGTNSASGTRVSRGTISVDPRIIRLKSHLFVPGYGHGRAFDTGKNIKFNRADLCFDSVREAKNFGRQWRNIYILERAT